MASNAQKTPITKSLNTFAMQKAQSALQLTGKALPCSVVKAVGAIITVKFEVTDPVFKLPNVPMPLFGPEYIRYPIQVGDKGFAVPADTYLGGMSGLGGGTADLTQRGNLATLAFLPIGNKNWTTVDPNAVTIYGPNGVVMRDTNSKSTIVLTPSGIVITGQSNVTIVVGGVQFAMTSSGITITGNLTINGNTAISGTLTNGSTIFSTHEHTGVMTGGGTSGPPVSGS